MAPSGRRTRRDSRERRIGIAADRRAGSGRRGAGRARHRRQSRPDAPGHRRPAGRRSRAHRRRARRRQDAARAHLRGQPRPELRAPAVHGRPAARRRHRLDRVRPAHRRLLVPPRPALRQRRAGRRGQPRHAAHAVRVPRGHGGAQRDGGRPARTRCRTRSSCWPRRTPWSSRARSRCPRRSSTGSCCACAWAIPSADEETAMLARFRSGDPLGGGARPWPPRHDLRAARAVVARGARGRRRGRLRGRAGPRDARDAAPAPRREPASLARAAARQPRRGRPWTGATSSRPTTCSTSPCRSWPTASSCRATPPWSAATRTRWCAASWPPCPCRPRRRPADKRA